MYWVSVSEDYLKFLRDNGDYRVPYSDYGENHFKPFLGVLFEKDGLSYVAQISSPRDKYIDRHSGLDFKKIYDNTSTGKGKLIGVIKLCNMVPVPKSEIKYVSYKEIDNFRKFKDNGEKCKYINFMKKELKVVQQLRLPSSARKTYEIKMNYPDSRLGSICLNFDKLEVLAHQYEEMQLRKQQENHPIFENISFQKLQEINKTVIGQKYEEAGEIRTDNIEIAEDLLRGLSIDYASPEDILDEANIVLERMENQDLENLPFDEKVNILSKDMADLWKTHVFKEANTETVLSFCCDYAEKKGVPIDRQFLELNSNYFRKAIVAYNANLTGRGDYSKPDYLHKIVKDALRRGESRAVMDRKRGRTMAEWNKDISKDRAGRGKTDAVHNPKVKSGHTNDRTTR